MSEPVATIKYLIADDHTVFRQGLRLVLGDDPALELVGEASNGFEVMERLKAGPRPDVILMDIRMPDMDGIEATKRVKEFYPTVRVLILTMHDDEQLILHLLEAGAGGYLIKNADAEEIKLAIHACAETGFYFSDHVSNTALKSLIYNNQAVPRFHHNVQLTEREREVLQYICEGLTAAEIGKCIFLSHRTVEGIKSSLLEKTGARNTAGLVMYAVKAGIVE